MLELETHVIALTLIYAEDGICPHQLPKPIILLEATLEDITQAFRALVEELLDRELGIPDMDIEELTGELEDGLPEENNYCAVKYQSMTSRFRLVR